MLWALLVQIAARVIQQTVQMNMLACTTSCGWQRVNSVCIPIDRVSIAIRLVGQIISSIAQTQPAAAHGYISRIKQQLICITTPHINQIKVRSTPIQEQLTAARMAIVIFGASLMNGLVRR